MWIMYESIKNWEEPEKLFISQEMWNELPKLQSYDCDLGPTRVLQTDTYIFKVLQPIAMTTDDKILVAVVDTVSYMGDE